ncbi:hypothetical protein Ga0074812_105227 [Parafrankia irregularis]|uniref:Uncharacterized protein n=1 Tax=Parafrankia irregularis TaxID=795642 RepID=A0A0S4QJ44_9ACTN|nr:hypothetical protein Ga0074812_105227 [Parafrankia irregularis]
MTLSGEIQVMLRRNESHLSWEMWIHGPVPHHGIDLARLEDRRGG